MENDWPQSDDEARARFEKWRHLDPYPEILPALLNSADIVDYVRTTGMLYPFREKKDGKDKLKTASYEVDVWGEYIWFDEHGEKKTDWLDSKTELVLRRNSIAFVQVEPFFRIPSYIALRFNLKITHVYRGILLATGPLVDPEFVGRLYIPLHNLTDNDYVLRGGDGLIWMEFTKLSPSAVWKGDSLQEMPRHGKLFSFPARKGEGKMTLLDYLRKADGNRPIRSSIPAEIVKSAASAEKAKMEAEKIGKWVTIGGFAAILALFVAVVGFFIAAMAFINIRAGQLEQRIDRLEDRRGAPSSPTATTAPAEIGPEE